MNVCILLILLILLGCGQVPRSSGLSEATSDSFPTRNDPLNETKWVLITLYGHPPLEGTILTLEFSKGNVSGSSGCNSIFGGENLSEKYKISDDGSLRIDFANTLVLCHSPEGIIEQEEAYFKGLRNVSEYRLTGNRLELRNKADDTILVFAK